MEFYQGQKVKYTPHAGVPQIGIVKSIADENNTFVVFNCAGEWNRYFNYTAQHTPNDRLSDGWECDHEYVNDSYKWGNPNRMKCIYCSKVID